MKGGGAAFFTPLHRFRHFKHFDLQLLAICIALCNYFLEFMAVRVFIRRKAIAVP